MAQRNVVVVMPFGGGSGVERRRAILHFKRLEYLIRDLCKVRSGAAGNETDYVVYDVKVCRTMVDEIPEHALQQILKADILVALIAGPNPNVIYEVAFRRAREGKLVLVVDTPEDLPLYLKSLVHHSWKNEAILERIDRMANDPLHELHHFGVEIPPELKQAIERDDRELQMTLQTTLQEMEPLFQLHEGPGLLHLRGIVSAECATFYPSSIVEVSFARKGEFANPLAPAVVRDFDDAFVRLYGYTNRMAADADRPLTLPKLLDRIKEFSDPDDWDKFMDEQTVLTEAVVRDYGFARATVPLRIDNSHPLREFRGTTYLPCRVAQVIDGKLNGPHNMYLLVMYIEVAERREQSKQRKESSYAS